MGAAALGLGDRAFAPLQHRLGLLLALQHRRIPAHETRPLPRRLGRSVRFE